MGNPTGGGMPHLNLPIDADGPVLTGVIWVSGPVRALLQAAGLPVPPPVNIRALVDTGASCTCLDGGVIARLGLTLIGETSVHTPSTLGTAAQHRMFDAQILVGSSHPPSTLLCNVESHPVVECDFSGQGIQALIGRDLLASAVLFYNGPASAFTLAF